MSYPNEPGYRPDEASMAAAFKTKPKTRAGRQKVLDELWKDFDTGRMRGLSTVQMADLLGGFELSRIGPRFSELERFGLAVKDGTVVHQERRVNLWRLSRKAVDENIRIAPKRTGKTHRLVGWMNIYQLANGTPPFGGMIHQTREEAHNAASAICSTRLACVRISIPFREGEGI